jgi:predicted transposase YdaD
MRYLVGKGEETMGLVSVLKEEGRQEGIQQGLLEGIETLLEIKFGERGLKLIPAIGKIMDTDRLRRIKEAIKVSREVQEVENVIWH